MVMDLFFFWGGGGGGWGWVGGRGTRGIIVFESLKYFIVVFT